ncbi:nucleoside deaminase, partial [Cyclobacteriaceae bacterium]|nr:nucleoside deaminase [Cyclobacteriaceae bacterium]
MQQALLQADLADQQLEIPVGAVIVCENKIIARAHNQVE